MDEAQYLKKLLEHDAWANREVLGALQSNSTERSRKLLSHIFSAEQLWLDRIEQKPQTLPVWPDLSLDRIAGHVSDLEKRWREHLLPDADLSREVNYKNTKGEPYSSRVDDIFLHVMAHSAYHRGQIAADLRASGITPPYTDFIHAVRQGYLKER